jgi:hypothetical protein
VDVREQIDRRTDLFSEIDVKPVQEKVFEVDDTLEISLKIINDVKHDQTEQVSLKLKLSSFDREKELRVAKILNTRNMSRSMQNLFLNIVETFGL